MEGPYGKLKADGILSLRRCAWLLNVGGDGCHTALQSLRLSWRRLSAVSQSIEGLPNARSLGLTSYFRRRGHAASGLPVALSTASAVGRTWRTVASRASAKQATAPGCRAGLSGARTDDETGCIGLIHREMRLSGMRGLAAVRN
jgi:hypothetical protein